MTAPRREDPAVEALARLLYVGESVAGREERGRAWDTPTIPASMKDPRRAQAGAVLAAIARGEVPGVTLTPPACSTCGGTGVVPEEHDGGTHPVHCPEGCDLPRPGVTLAADREVLVRDAETGEHVEAPAAYVAEVAADREPGGTDAVALLAAHAIGPWWCEVRPETSPGAGDGRYARHCTCGVMLDARDVEGSHRLHLADVLADREPDGLRADLAALLAPRPGRDEEPHVDWMIPASTLRALLAAHPATDQPEVDRG